MKSMDLSYSYQMRLKLIVMEQIIVPLMVFSTNKRQPTYIPEIQQFRKRNKNMWSLIFLLFINTSVAQIAAEGSNLTFLLAPAGNLSLATDPYSPFYPNDFYRNIQYLNSKIYTLGSNNIVQVYNKTNPTSMLQSFNEYSYAYGLPYAFIFLSVNPSQNLLVLTSYASGKLQHLSFGIDSTGAFSFCNITGDHLFEEAPIKVFIRENLVYSYFRQEKGNDWVYIANIISNSSHVITLGQNDCQIAVSPDRRHAVVWNSHTELYIHSVDQNFTLLHVDDLSRISPKDKTNSISFSGDSSLAIVETDSKGPIRIINLTDFSTVDSILADGTITSTAFLDPQNRFVLIKFVGDLQVYDRQEGNLIDLNGTLTGTAASASDSELFDESVAAVDIFTISINAITRPLESQPNQTSNMSNPSASIDPSNFYFTLNLTEAQNQTISQIGQGLSAVITVIDYSFSAIFSSPVTCFFLSLFNHFTLSSLYLLLNLKIPYTIFYYLSLLYTSCASNVVLWLGVQIEVVPFSPDRVTDLRPLYFEITSDIFSANFIPFLLVGGNCLLYELLIILTGSLSPKLKKLHNTLVHLRMQVYWGMVVSNMVSLILPWKYSFFGGVYDFRSKINTALQYLLLPVLLFCLLASLLSEWLLAKKSKSKHKVKAALREWWSQLQNFMYPLLLLVDNPIYFLSVIGLTNFINLYNSFFVDKWRALSVLKACYPVVFHSCFITFLVATDNLTLVIASIVCLSTFLAGSVHHLLETVYVVIRLLFKLLSSQCKANRAERGRVQAELKSQQNIFSLPAQTPCAKKSKIQEILKQIDDEIKLNSSMSSRMEVACLAEKEVRREVKRKKKVKFTREARVDEQIKIHWVSKLHKTEAEQ